MLRTMVIAQRGSEPVVHHDFLFEDKLKITYMSVSATAVIQSTLA